MGELDLLRRVLDLAERESKAGRPMQMKQRLTLDTDATIYGCCALFDLCADD